MIILFDEIGKLSSSDAKPIWVALKFLMKRVNVSAFVRIVAFLAVIFQDFVLLNQQKSTSIIDKFLLRVHRGSKAAAASSGTFSERVF